MAALTFSQIEAQVRALLSDAGAGSSEFTPEQMARAIDFAQVQSAKQLGITYHELSLQVVNRKVAIPLDAISVVRVEISNGAVPSGIVVGTHDHVYPGIIYAGMIGGYPSGDINFQIRYANDDFPDGTTTEFPFWELVSDGIADVFINSQMAADEYLMGYFINDEERGLSSASSTMLTQEVINVKIRPRDWNAFIENLRIRGDNPFNVVTRFDGATNQIPVHWVCYSVPEHVGLLFQQSDYLVVSSLGSGLWSFDHADVMGWVDTLPETGFEDCVWATISFFPDTEVLRLDSYISENFTIQSLGWLEFEIDRSPGDTYHFSFEVTPVPPM